MKLASLYTYVRERIRGERDDRAGDCVLLSLCAWKRGTDSLMEGRIDEQLRRKDDESIRESKGPTIGRKRTGNEWQITVKS